MPFARAYLNKCIKAVYRLCFCHFILNCINNFVQSVQMEIENNKRNSRAQKEAEDNKGIDLDTILVEEIGQFGKYQLRTVLLTAAVAVFTSWINAYLFTSARINTRCFIPECDPQDGVPEFAPSWVLHAIPGSSPREFDGCQRFGNATSAAGEGAGAGAGETNGTCPAALFDQSHLLPCQSYVYENTDTVVYDFDLACDEWRRSFIGSMRTFGVLIGIPVSGYVSDRWGRRTSLAISAFNTAWIGITRLSATNYVGFISSEFLEAALGASYTSAYILAMELVGPKFRVMIGATMNSFFAVGQMLMGLIAWALPYWKHLTLALYLPQLLTIFYFWILSESVRWYMSKGRYEESEAVLKEVARVNGKKLSEKSLIALRQTIEEEKKKEALKKAEKAKEPMLIVQVFRHRAVLIRCLVSPIWWITGTLIYYGLSINAVNLSGNGYLNYVAVSAIEIPGCWTAVLLMGKVGRKPVLIVGYWLCALCQIAYIFMPNGLYGASLVMYLFGKCSIAAVMTALYTYTAELFPTRHRNSLFAFACMMGRIGTIVAPLTPALGAAVWEDLPFALFAVFALLSGLLVFTTPETLGSKFPDTMEEASEIGRKRKANV